MPDPVLSTLHVLSHPCSNPMGEVPPLPPFYKWGRQGTKRAGSVLKDTGPACTEPTVGRQKLFHHQDSPVAADRQVTAAEGQAGPRTREVGWHGSSLSFSFQFQFPNGPGCQLGSCSSSSASSSAISCHLGTAGAMETYRLYQKPGQELGAFIQDVLRPSDDCQKRIEEAVDTICAALQKAGEQPLVTSVAKVSRGLGSGILGARRVTWC